MDNKEILRFADMLKWEFFSRLKDETAPAGKEFSYVDLLSLLDIAYKKFGISAKDKAEFERERPSGRDLLKAVAPELLASYEASLKEAESRNKK